MISRVRALLACPDKGRGARRKNVWSLKMRVEKLHYMHMNPLNRKLVDHPKDWPRSSFSFYSNPKHGLIRVDPIL
jgi:hypothetical protein